MDLNSIKRVYFIGIGGIGMSALARYFLYFGKEVSGYDKTPSDITRELEKEGINIHYEDDIDKIPNNILTGLHQETLIIYTPAIPSDHSELNFFLSREFLVRKRAKILGAITMDKTTIAVAGSHGKTSIATIITHLLNSAKIDFYALLGGISINSESNFYAPKKDRSTNLFIVEADEFDRSFLQLSPDFAIVNSTDPDHLDIYENHENLQQAYQEFVNHIKYNGTFAYDSHVQLVSPNSIKNSFSYGLNTDNDFYAYNIRVSGGAFIFNVKTPFFELNDIHLKVPGEHNILNILAALTVVTGFVKDKDILKHGIETYKGVRRRFEYVLDNKDHIFIDDYAHHPTEIQVTVDTLKVLYPTKKITAIFQPHLFSRTLDFFIDFGRVLSRFDKVILLDIYPARELPIKGVSSCLIFEKICHENKFLTTKEGMIQLIKQEPKGTIILTLGAGDIDRMVQPIKEILLEN